MSITPPYNFKQVLQRSFEAAKNALRVLVINDATSPVPVEIVTGGSSSTIKTFIGETDFTTNNPEVFISETVPVGKTWNLKRASVTCRQNVNFRVLVDSVLVGSGRLGSSVLNRDFDWVDGYEVAAGSTVEIQLTLLFGKPTNSAAEAYLMVREI